MKAQITIVYEWSEDGWWVGEVAEVPGAISQGRTREETKKNVLDALALLKKTRRDLALKGAKEAANIETVLLAS